MHGGVEVKGLEDADRAVETLVLNGKEKEFVEKARKLRALYELLSPSDTTFKHLEFYKLAIYIAIALNRYRRIGIRLPEIERAARKTYELIQKTVGIESVEKIGEVNIAEELSKLEAEGRPMNALRVLGEFRRITEGFKSDSYVSIREEIEKKIDEMKEEKRVTRSIIERIKSIQGRLKVREEEKKKFKEIFPVFAVMRDCFQDVAKVQEVSKNIIQELRNKELLCKESFLKKSLRKEVKRIVRESIVKSF